MSAVKERTISAMDASTLASRDSAIMPVDRIGALAQAPHFGADLWHVMNLDRQSLRSAIFRLAKMLRTKDRIAQSMAEKVATQAIAEKYIPQCVKCSGTGEFNTGEVVRVCPTCSGSGKRRYSDNDRARAIGVTVEQFAKGWNRKLDTALKLLDDAEWMTERNVRRALR